MFGDSVIHLFWQRDSALERPRMPSAQLRAWYHRSESFEAPSLRFVAPQDEEIGLGIGESADAIPYNPHLEV